MAMRLCLYYFDFVRCAVTALVVETPMFMRIDYSPSKYVLTLLKNSVDVEYSTAAPMRYF